MEKTKEENKILNYTKKTLKILICLFTGLTLLFVSLCWLDHLNFYSLGLTYLPPIWLIIFIIPAIIACLIAGSRKLAGVTLIFYLVFLLLYGDFTLIKPSYKINEDKGKKISVLALNVQYYQHGIEKVVKGIKDMNADISLLSENTLDEEKEAYFKKEFELYDYYMGKKDAPAIISRYPIIEAKEVELPSHQASLFGPNKISEQNKNPHRSFIHAIIDVEGTALHAISIRFIAGRPESQKISHQLEWGNYLSKTHIEEVNFFKDYVEKLDGPVIFGGDLNAPPSSKPIKVLNKMATDAYMAKHFYGTLTFSVETTILRLDYIFFKNNAVPLKCEVLDYVVSDHYPLYGEFLLTD